MDVFGSHEPLCLFASVVHKRKREREMRQDSCMAEKGLKLFGVRIVGDAAEDEEEEVMRKSSSMGNLAAAAPAPAESGGTEQGYLSDGGLVQSSRRRGGNERKRGDSSIDFSCFLFFARF